MQLKTFQEETIEKLRKAFLNLWQKDEKRLPLVLKSPTWSWKTVMTAEFLRKLVLDPQFQVPKAYVWLSFSEEIVMQSKKKLFKVYDWAWEITLLDLNDLNNRKFMKNNNVFFANWQKLKATNKDGRKLRRETEKSVWDKWVFDEFIINTQKQGIELVLIIDEAHSWSDTKLADEIIDLIDPKIIFKITATPSEKDELSALRLNSFVDVPRKDVIAEWLIKEKLITQTQEDLAKVKKEWIDQDKLLLELAYNKRLELKSHYEELWLDINPLVLIQLPNDDKDQKEELWISKEDLVKSFLREKKVKDEEVAIWLSEKKENLDYVERNNSWVSFLIFKQAAATGWDCPRAWVLVMFREIKKPDFHTQTVWRILRMPLWEHFTIPELNIGYLYTNYERNDLKVPDNVNGENKPFVYKSDLKLWIEQIDLESIYLWRIDYNDLNYTFEKTLVQTLNDFFDIKEDDILKTEDEKFQKLANAGVDITKNKIIYNMIVDVEVENFDHFFEELKAKWTDIEASISKWDLERLFDLNIYTLIANQEEEKRKYAPARSWKAFRNAINAWFCAYISSNRVIYKAILINDLSKEDSVFRNIIGKALEIYKPIRIKEVEEKEKRQEQTIKLKVPKRENWYTDDYIEITDVKKSAIIPFYTHKNKVQNEMDFIKFLEEKENILWWYKNWDSWSEYFAIKYYDTFKQTERLFYVDFIAKLKNWKILMVDTKDWITATPQETKDKAEALQKWIKNQKDLDIIWGIVLNSWWTWKINNKETYNIDVDYSEFVDLGSLI